MKFADRITRINESKTISLFSVVEEMKAKGIDVISLSVGESDYQTPVSVIDATKKALEENKTRYSTVPGLTELRQAIAKKVLSCNSIADITSNNILVANGAKQIIYNVFQTICDPGDEVIIPIPYWVTFPESIKLSGGVPVFVETTNHQLDLNKIQAAITEKTKAILINTPNNPSGAIYSEESLRELALLACENDLFIVADEAYQSLTYDGVRHFSIASISPEVFERTITIQSFSKDHFMTGFRIGYMIASEEVIGAVTKFQGHVTGNNCTFAQYGAIAALENTSEVEHRKIIATFERRRNICFDLCSKIFDCIKPTGAFFVFANVEKYLGLDFKTCDDLALHILNNAHVAVVPGSAFGMPGNIRISFATSEENIENALNRIGDLLCK